MKQRKQRKQLNALTSLSDICPQHDWARLERHGLPEKRLRDAIAESQQTPQPVTPAEAYALLKSAHRFDQAVCFAQYPEVRFLTTYLQVLKYPATTGGITTAKKMERYRADASS